MNERFTVKRIQGIGKAVADFFNKELIKTVPDLERRVGGEFLGLQEQEFITVTLNPSNRGTRAYTVSYTVLGSGIPIEVKMNPQRGYSALITKAEEPLFGFSSFATDSNGNNVQHAFVKSLDVQEICDVLRSLNAYGQN